MLLPNFLQCEVKLDKLAAHDLFPTTIDLFEYHIKEPTKVASGHNEVT